MTEPSCPAAAAQAGHAGQAAANRWGHRANIAAQGHNIGLGTDQTLVGLQASCPVQLSQCHPLPPPCRHSGLYVVCASAVRGSLVHHDALKHHLCRRHSHHAQSGHMEYIQHRALLQAGAPEASRSRCIGCHATAATSLPWPCQEAISRLVCRTSHTLTVRSRLQEASQVPFRFQQTCRHGERVRQGVLTLGVQGVQPKHIRQSNSICACVRAGVLNDKLAWVACVVCEAGCV